MPLLHRLQGQTRTFGQHLVETDGARQGKRGHHFLDLAHDEVDDGAFQSTQQITHGGDDHMLDLGMRQHLLHRGGEVFQHDDRFTARIDQLVLQFTGRVQRVDVHHGIAGAQNRRHGHRILQHVRQHDRHARTALQALALQPGTHLPRQLIELAIGHEFIHAHEGVAVRIFLERLFQQMCYGTVLRAIYLCGNAVRV